MLDEPIVHVVDDDCQVRELLRVTVAAMGLQVEVAESAEEFLARFDPERLNCLIVDLRLPGTSGLELLDQLRQRQCDLAAILISGQATVADAVQAMKWGAIDFLEKPYSLAALRDAVRRALARQQIQRQRAATRKTLLQRVGGLTSDERTVVRLTASGEPDKRIAAMIDVSTRTVQLRRASAMRKLRVDTRAELIRLVESLSPEMWDYQLGTALHTAPPRCSGLVGS